MSTILCGNCGRFLNHTNLLTTSVAKGLKKELEGIIKLNKMVTRACPGCKSSLLFYEVYEPIDTNNIPNTSDCEPCSQYEIDDEVEFDPSLLEVDEDLIEGLQNSLDDTAEVDDIEEDDIQEEIFDGELDAIRRKMEAKPDNQVTRRPKKPRVVEKPKSIRCDSCNEMFETIYGQTYCQDCLEGRSSRRND